MPQNDDGFGVLNLPIVFQLLGESSTTAYIGTNGLISLQSKTAIPGAFPPSLADALTDGTAAPTVGVLAAFWEDADTRGYVAIATICIHMY